jgi:uncharacterized membrane protein
LVIPIDGGYEMKKIAYAIMVLVLLSIVPIVHAAVDGCFDIEVDVNDDTVKPGESFTIKVTVDNNSTMDMDDDLDVEIAVEEMDDGDDYEDDGTIDALDSGDDDKIEFDVETPYAIDEGTYDITVKVSGTTTNNTKCETTVNSSVEVEKDKHELILVQPTVSLDTLKCSRSTDVSTTLWNIGTKDEDIELSVYNTELGINQKQTFTLDEGNDEDDIKATKITTLDLKDVKAGTYTFYVKAAYDSNNKQKTASFALKVEDCATTRPVTTQPVVQQPNYTQPVITQVQQPITSQMLTVPAVVEEPSFMSGYGTILLLGLAYVVVIIIGVLLVISLIRKQ